MSVATVSRVLSNDGEGVRPLTQEAVRAAAAELGYQYHGVAAALRRRRTMQVGVVVPRIANPYFAGLVEALERSLAPLGFDLLLADAQENPATEKARIQSLLNRRADALVIVPTHEQESAPALAPAAGIPVIQLDRRVEDFEADWVGTDNRVGMAALVAHLRARGHHRVGFLGAKPTNTTARERLQGFRDAHPDAPALLRDFSMEWGERAFRKLRAQDPAVSAVVCANDLLAYGVLRACRADGLRVPDDIVVTGFDDLPFSAIVAPGLTTVRQPVANLAATATRLLQQRLTEGGAAEPPRRLLLESELVIRESSAAVRSNRPTG